MPHQPTQPAQLQHLAYNALTTYFTEHADEVLEIEILPPAFEPENDFFLQEGRNLGLPKKTLVGAFLHARHLFFTTKDSLDEEEKNRALEATQVLLLFDPEFLTVAHHRKRHILRLHGTARTSASWQELRFLDSILTSPLHRQSKSPTLWSHRFWLLSLLLLDKGVDLPAFFALELDAACTSGDRHPKNYYAWQYARRLFPLACARLSSAEWSSFVCESVEKVKGWCCVRPSDISGWMFLAWLLDYAEVAQRMSVLREVVEYAVSVRLTNEALWVFVRAVLVDVSLDDTEVRNIVQLLREDGMGRVTGEKEVFGERVERTLEWVGRNSVTKN